jgi:transposase
MMPAPYSVDLRWRIVHACERAIQSQREVAELFQVSQATVENIWRLYRRTGDVTPQRLHRMGAPVRIDEKAREQLRRSLENQPDMTLAELQERLVRHSGILVSTSRICRVLQQMGLRRKKRMYMPRNGTLRAYVRLVGNTAGA